MEKIINPIGIDVLSVYVLHIETNIKCLSNIYFVVTHHFATFVILCFKFFIFFHQFFI